MQSALIAMGITLLLVVLDERTLIFFILMFSKKLMLMESNVSLLHVLPRSAQGRRTERHVVL